MTAENFKYAMLLASLPAHPSKLFSAQQTPISSIQLEKRLSLLEERDAKDLRCIEELLLWSQIDNASDDFIIKKSLEIIETISEPFLKNVIVWRLELRTILCALRLRHEGAKQPHKNTFPGVGRWLNDIENNWEKIDFGIGHRIPWIIKAEYLLKQSDTYELEKLLLNLVWQYYANECQQHYFDFPAVVIYVLRWDILNRWTLYHADDAVKRFDDLVDAGLESLALAFNDGEFFENYKTVNRLEIK